MTRSTATAPASTGGRTVTQTASPTTGSDALDASGVGSGGDSDNDGSSTAAILTAVVLIVIVLGALWAVHRSRQARKQNHGDHNNSGSGAAFVTSNPTFVDAAPAFAEYDPYEAPVTENANYVAIDNEVVSTLAAGGGAESSYEDLPPSVNYASIDDEDMATVSSYEDRRVRGAPMYDIVEQYDEVGPSNAQPVIYDGIDGGPGGDGVQNAPRKGGISRNRMGSVYDGFEDGSVATRGRYVDVEAPPSKNGNAKVKFLGGSVYDGFEDGSGTNVAQKAPKKGGVSRNRKGSVYDGFEDGSVATRGRYVDVEAPPSKNGNAKVKFLGGFDDDNDQHYEQVGPNAAAAAKGVYENTGGPIQKKKCSSFMAMPAKEPAQAKSKPGYASLTKTQSLTYANIEIDSSAASEPTYAAAHVADPNYAPLAQERLLYAGDADADFGTCTYVSSKGRTCIKRLEGTSESAYCGRHTCSTPRCTQPKSSGEIFCPIHTGSDA